MRENVISIVHGQVKILFPLNIHDEHMVEFVGFCFDKHLEAIFELIIAPTDKNSWN